MSAKLDEKALARAVKRAMENAGTLPAKGSVKLVPADWHRICDLALAPMSADTAPAAMPGEAEPNDAPCYLSASEASAWASGFNAAHQALAPILAEKEREYALASEGRAAFAARALAAEAALAAERERADMAVRQMIKQNDRLAAIRAQE